MRARPITLPTTAAAPELLIINPGQWLQFVEDLGFLGRFKRRVAAETTGKRRKRGSEIKPAQHFHGLFQWILRAQIIAVTHRGMHEKAPVASEERAILIADRPDQLS